MIQTLLGSNLPAAQLALAAPTILAGAAFVAARISPTARTSWLVARVATAIAVAVAFATLTVGTLAATPAIAPGLVLLLVTSVGAVITRFSATYLDGEAGQARFVGWLLATLAGATLVIATDHLLVLLVAWLATSLCLQNLLTFYADRPIAQLAAHKKFLCSRAADLCVLAAALVLMAGPGELNITALAASAADGVVDGATATAMILIAVATLLKGAQLPFHGWLMQVMEAPTPISALLHAGVVNLGGYVLIRFGTLLGAVPAAQTLLVVVGSLTAVLAALVATTRVSIKVTLAWSTCAQMGFMLLQCGLGLYSMALLHLIGHSIYKAHAFLAAGGAVQRTTTARIARPSSSPGVVVRLACSAVVMSALVAIAAWLEPHALEQPNLLAMMFVVGLAAGAMPRRTAQTSRTHALLAGASRSVLLATIWFGLHGTIESLGLVPAAQPPVALAWVAAIAFAGLAAIDLLRTDFPHTAIARALQRWFQEGMHLDGWFTRLTLRVFRWRPRAAPRTSEPFPIRVPDSQ